MMAHYIALRISSNFVNVLNFLIFDAVLISLVYLLTADVMSRLNDSTLRDGESHRLIVTCPPVLGGGLCSTHRTRALLLLTVRLLGLGLILMTNLTIEGETRNRVIEASADVVVRGNVTDFVDEVEFHSSVLLRTSCQGHRPPAAHRNEGNATIVYYGDLRRVREKGNISLQCVTDRELITGTVVEFSSDWLKRNVKVDSVDKCTVRRRAPSLRGRSFSTVQYLCPSATLSCYQGSLRSCRGIVRYANETYITEDGSSYPGMTEVTARVAWVKGVDYRDTSWMDSIFFSSGTMKDAIDAAYGARIEKRMVKQKVPEEWTIVSVWWLAAFVVKLFLVLALGLTALSLERANFRTVAHDEQRLAELLSTVIEENSMHEKRKTGCEEGIIFLNACRSADGLLATADIHPRTAELRRQNSDFHRLEEMHA